MPEQQRIGAGALPTEDENIRPGYRFLLVNPF
jgi:hypothetical protein